MRLPWVTPEQFAQLRKEEQRLINEAGSLIETSNGALAEDKLTAASKSNPEGIAADFLLGLYYSLVQRKAAAAEQHFLECVKRLRRKADLSNEDRANLMASLNNLAIVEVRQKKHPAALKHWKEATQAAPASAEVIQNVGRFVYLARMTPKLGIQKTTGKSAGDLFASLSAQSEGRHFKESVGWLYIGSFSSSAGTPHHDSPATGNVQSSSRDKPASAGMPITVAFGSGFVIHPGFIVTNNHVVADADDIIIHTRTNQETRHKAKLISVSPKEDIALLQCVELTLPAVAFSLEPPKLASDLLVLGYPELDVVGTDLKATRGSVSGLPNPDIGNRLLYDATTNSGNSGGPVCDQHGQAIALHRGAYLLSGKLAMGVPAAVVLEFLKKELPAFKQPSASPVILEWSQVAETVGESTVLIEILQVPTRSQAIASTVPTRTAKRSGLQAFEDPWCMLCNGSGEVACPARNCARGIVPATATSVIAVDPSSGGRITSSVETGVPCPNCDGKGRVACQYCVDGIDPTVQGSGDH